MAARRVKIKLATNHELHSFEECVRRVAIATAILERIARRIDREKASEPSNDRTPEERTE